MKRGGTFLVTVAILTCTACLGDGGRLEIRSASSGLKAGDEPVPFRIAEARGHLALGNVALALEGFRKAAREDPSSVDALAGIAQCYDLMQRFDLSRRNYEMALAIAPRNSALLASLATSLDAQGKAAEAASVRREIAALTAAETAPATTVAEAAAPLPPDVAAPVGQSVTIALAPPRPADTAPAKSPDPGAMQVAPVGKSVTIALPPSRAAPAIKASPVIAKAAPPVAKAPPTRRPHLERLSLTEVALVSGEGPRWTRPSAHPLRVAARSAPAPTMEIRVLNAARVDKLAARTRAFLGNHGWHAIAIGDAAAVRQRSLIVYPKGKRAAADRLSTRLGFAAAPRDDVRQLTILLGRDAATHPALRMKS